MFSGAWCGGMGVGGWLLMVAFWSAFLALAVWAITRIFPDRAATEGAPEAIGRTPSELGDQPLASGQIDVENQRRLRDEPHRLR